MKGSILLFGAALLCSSVLRAGSVCTAPNTEELACIYSNFGEGQSYQQNVGLTPGYTAVGVAFIPYTNFLLMNLEVAAYRASEQTPDSVNFSIYDSSGVFPGTLLESFALTGLGIEQGVTISAASVLHPLLTAGMQYWVVMDGVSPGDVAWNWNSTGQLGAATVLAPASEGDPAYWSSLGNYPQGAFALDGNPTVPEPGTFVLGLSLAGLALFRRPRG